MWAGTGVGLVREVLPARQIVEQVRKDAIAALKRVAG
jgi:NAD(P)H-dependent flavin oxidoreductase YrpB (nitropropane dioxygenase family)